jgi:hypothetical protein
LRAGGRHLDEGATTVTSRIPPAGLAHHRHTRRRRPPARRRLLPTFEPIEERVLPSAFGGAGVSQTFTVVTTADSGDGSLRAAILAANANPGLDTIAFAIPASGVQTIQPTSPLPALSDLVVIDGYTQPLAHPNTLTSGNDANLLIKIDGSLAGTTPGLVIGGSAAGSTVRGLIIDKFSGDGIALYGSGHNTIQGNIIGTDAAGTPSLGNSGHGVGLYNAGSNTIGTDGDGNGDAGEGNVIAGNAAEGVDMEGTGSNFNVVAGNFIGTNPAGAAGLGNKDDGVLLDQGAHDNRIGTDGLGPNPALERNVISGNVHQGVLLTDFGTDTDPVSGNLIAGNFIGTDPAGTHALGNGVHGVVLNPGATGNTVGGSGLGNVISGNVVSGVVIGATSSNRVQGNLIGTDATGSAPLGNGYEGIGMFGAVSNLIGTDGDGNGDAGEGNVIAASAQSGIEINGTGATQNVVAGNFIGTNSAAAAGLGNHNNGLTVDSGAHDNRIGTNGLGPNPALEGNVISGNIHTGIVLSDFGTATDPVSGNLIAGNFIGTDPTGAHALGNTGDGVDLLAFASGNTVGGLRTGPTLGPGNVISGNTGNGIGIGQGNHGNALQGNLIGTELDGFAPLGNGGSGVAVGGSSTGDTIGGAAAGAGNAIAHNGFTGVVVNGVGTLGITISQNAIDGNGTLGIDLGSDGVTPNHSGGLVSGPNGLQNHPVLLSALNSNLGSNPVTTITGRVDGAASTSYTVEFFASPTASPSGFGQGLRFLGSATVTTDGSGSRPFAYNFYAPYTAPTGWSISATATDPGGNTSEFSNDVTAQAFSMVSLAASPGAPTYGQPVTLTATVSPPEATGTVTFYDNGTAIGTGTLSGGVATFTTSALAVGAHALTAAYAGDPDDTPSTSAALNLTVGQGTTSVSVVANPNPALWGSSLTLTATVSPSTATGTVTFSDESGVLGTGTLSGGVATLLAGSVALGPGGHQVTASYGGDASDAPATSPAVQFNVVYSLVVTNTNDSGPGSLRQALSDANADTNMADLPVVEIDFAITDGARPTPGTWTITPTTPLPAIFRPVVINGESQSGYAGHPIIELSGATAGGNGLALRAGSDGSTIEGLVVNRFSGNGIVVRSSNNKVQGNWVGTDATGTAAAPNGTGIDVQDAGVTGNLIGGPNQVNPDGTVTRILGNVISGNSGIGIITQLGASSTMIQGNVVGLDATGEAPLGNGSFGIRLLGTTNDLIGGTDTIKRNGTYVLTDGNVVTADGNNVIKLNNATGAKVQGNYLGTDVTGERSILTFDGLSVINTQNALIGGPDFGQGNLIALGYAIAPGQGDTPDTGPWAAGAYGYSQGTIFEGNRIGLDADASTVLGNPIDGLDFDSAQDVTVRRNLIYGSTHSGIDIYATDFDPAGVTVTQNLLIEDGLYGISFNHVGNTPNHPGGLIAGPNGYQNHPVLESALFSAAGMIVSGTLDAAPSTSYTVEFFASPFASPSGFGEGDQYFWTATVMTDNTGHASFTADTDYEAPFGWVISSTATDPGGNTSEFSNDVVATLSPSSVSLAATPTASVYGQPVTLTATVSPATVFGTVTFYDGLTPLGTGTIGAGGIATLTTDALDLGSHTITAAYGGDRFDGPSTSADVTQAVTPATTTMHLSTPYVVVEIGQPVTFAAFVSAASPSDLTPTGTVQFSVDNVLLGAPVPVVGGVAVSTPVSTLALGSHLARASFVDPSGRFRPRSIGLLDPQVVAFTSVSLAASPPSSIYGQPVTITATVTNLDTPAVVTGNVVFYDGTTKLGVRALSGGQATLTTSALAASTTREVTAVFLANGPFWQSLSAVVVPVAQAKTTTLLSVSASGPYLYGTPVPLIAVVNNLDTGVTPNGTVTFKEGTQVLGRIQVGAGGVATLNRVLNAGFHSIVASYSAPTTSSGSPNFVTSDSDPYALTVDPDRTAATLNYSTPQTIYGQTVTFTASASNLDGPAIPTGGRVTYYVNYGTPRQQTLGSAPMVAGASTFTTRPTGLPVGSNTVTAVYGGTGNYLGSVTQTVPVSTAAAHTSTTLSVNTPGDPYYFVSFGTPLTFTVNVSDTDTALVPTGVVWFVDGGADGSAFNILRTPGLLNGTATFSTSKLSRGTHVIHVDYLTTTNFIASRSNLLTVVVF